MAAVAIGTYCWQPNFGAKWHIIDDHEILHFLGQSDRVALGRVPSLLAETEAGAPGRTTRYRPSYYGLRLLETAVWGRDVHLWYVARFVLFIVCASALLFLTIDHFGVLGAGFGAVFLMRGYWADIFAKLGPAETYAALGVAIYAVCFREIWTRERPNFANWVGLTGGAIIAAGSKENFVLLAIPLVWLALRLWGARRLTVTSIAAVSITLLCILAIAMAASAGVAGAGHDVYAQPVSFGARLGLALHLFRFRIVQMWIVCAGLLVVARLVVGGSEAPTDARRFATAMVVLLAIYASQYTFYNGNFPAGMRYDFPGVLARDLALLFCVWEFVVIVRACAPPSANQRQAAFASIAAFAIFFAANVQTLAHGRLSAERNRKTTVAFTNQLEAIALEMRARPFVPIVVTAHQASDYEPVFSIERFLRSYGVTNPLFLKVLGASAQPGQSTLELRLNKVLADVSANGRGGFLPFGQLSAGVTCASIGLSGNPLAGCRDLGRLW